MGLQTVVIGRMKYVTGAGVYAFVERMMEQANGQGPGGAS